MKLSCGVFRRGVGFQIKRIKIGIRGSYPRFSTALMLVWTILVLAWFPSSAQIDSRNSLSSGNASSIRSTARQLIAAKSTDERTIVLREIATSEKAAVAKEILDEVDRLAGKLAPAEIARIGRIALEIAESSGNKREAARAWNTIGTSQESDADKLASFTNGLASAKDAAANELAVQLIVNIGRLQTGTKSEEIEWYKSALPYAERCEDRKILSGLLGRIGNGYAQNGEFEMAREYHRRSLEIKKAMDDRLGVATTISNLGVIFGMLGDMSSAHQNFKESYEILQSIPDDGSAALVQRKIRDLRNLGIVNQGMGNTTKALEYYSMSLKMSEDVKWQSGVYGALFQLASLYNGQGDYELARQALLRADNVSEYEDLNPELLHLLAQSYSGEGKYELALSAVLRKLKETQKSTGKDDLSRLLIHIGDAYLSLRDFKTADDYFDRAMKIAVELKSEVPTLWALSGMSRSKLGSLDFSSSLDYALRAKEQFKVFNGVQESWVIYVDIGNAYAGLGKKELAMANYQQAIDILDSSQPSVTQQARLGVAVSSALPSQMMVRSLFADDPEKALFYAEQSRARLLLDTLGRGKLEINNALNAEEKRTEQDFRNRLASLNTQIEIEKTARVKTPNKINELEKQRSDLRREFAVFRNSLYSKYPDLSVQRGEFRRMGPNDVKALIPDANTAFIEFVVAPYQTFVFIVTQAGGRNKGLKVFQIDKQQTEIATLVKRYRAKTATGALDFTIASKELYQLLIKAAETELAGKTNIIIVPDGPLWDLPFQALMDDNGKYLIEKTAISYAPSLTALREMKKRARTRKPSPDAELLAFGNPLVAKETTERVRRVFMNEKLEPIPEAERLVNELGRMYGPSRSKVYVGNAAREEVAKTESPKYRIVQFATHGILNNVSPMYSHLVMSQDAKNPNEDGLLEAWELKDLDLKADMVILTACETARGKISSGEGIIGMTWASFIAGAPTTVASQWKVESSSTTELMLEFHRQLLSKKPVSKAEALRRASLKIMKIPKYRHPSYWGGWVLVGDGS